MKILIFVVVSNLILTLFLGYQLNTAKTEINNTITEMTNAQIEANKNILYLMGRQHK